MKTNVVLLLLGLVVLALGAPKVKDVREESALKGEMSTDEDLQPSANVSSDLRREVPVWQGGL